MYSSYMVYMTWSQGVKVLSSSPLNHSATVSPRMFTFSTWKVDSTYSPVIKSGTYYNMPILNVAIPLLNFLLEVLNISWLLLENKVSHVKINQKKEGPIIGVLRPSYPHQSTKKY